jgi:uncharacterized MAPEG superfamily protein
VADHHHHPERKHMTDPRKDLTRAADRWRKAKQKEREAMNQFDTAVRAAIGAGVGQREAATLAAVDRHTVRRALGLPRGAK